MAARIVQAGQALANAWRVVLGGLEEEWPHRVALKSWLTKVKDQWESELPAMLLEESRL